jgi:hypothetical protein
VIGPSTQPFRPLCGQLEVLHLHYKRWLRGLEKTGIIQVFGDIIASAPAFSVHLSFDEEPEGQIWKVHEPVARLDHEHNGIWIGFPSEHGIVPISTTLNYNGITSPLFRESVYLRISNHPSGQFPINLLSPFHNLRELWIHGPSLTVEPTTEPPSYFPLFHALKVLCVDSIQSSLLAGQTFYSLERYWEGQAHDKHNLSQRLLTEMPVCTRLDLELSSLATLKLPQIRELGIRFDHLEPNMIWEKHVVVNANLSGLRLMHVWGWNSPKMDVARILTSLPALETLIIVWQPLNPLGVEFFRAILPMDTNGTAGLIEESGKGDVPAVLCPNLESLQIEGVDLMKQPKLIPALKKIVSLRAVVGSPLKSFTFMDSGRKWEMIGRDGRLTMEEVVPAEEFRLDI